MALTDIEEVLKDKEFQSQPLDVQFSLLRRNYPAFNALDTKTQGTLVAKTRMESQSQEIEDNKPGFFSTLATDIPNMVKGLLPHTTGDINQKGGPGPIDTVAGMAGAQIHHVTKGVKDALAGNVLGGAGDVAAGLVPVFGPAAHQIGDDDTYGAMAAHTLEMVGPEALRILPSGAINPKWTRNIKNVNNATEESALKSVDGKVRMTPGQRAGQQGLQSSERDLVNKPGTANEAHDFYAGQQQDLTKVGQGLNKLQRGQVTNQVGAGEAIQDSLTGRVKNVRDYADKLYDSVRQTTARNKQQVQTGVTNTPASSIVDQYGNPAIPAGTKPVMETVETPVQLAPIRQNLQQVYTELSRNLPEAKRANSPAYQALSELMTSDKQVMPAMDFDKFLGAVKALTRDGTSDVLSTQSQRLARQVIAAGEKEFQTALGTAGPNVLDKLSRARKAVREYHNAADLLGDLNSEPGALYANLTTGGERVNNTLEVLHQKAPQALQTVGRTYLEQLLNKATAEGGFGRSEGLWADWQRLGKDSKNLLFGPTIAGKFDEFLLAAKRLTPGRGSATSDRMSALGAYGDVGVAIGEVIAGSLLGHPGYGIVGAGGTLLRTRVQPGILARLSFRPNGAQLLKNALTLPVASTQFIRTMQALNAMAIESESDKE